MSPAPDLRGEEGFTMVEVIVATMIGMIVFLGVFAIVDASSRNSIRTQIRVEANQLARPGMTRIIDALHSSCVGPQVAPVQPNSTGSSISFLHKTGDDVNPTPNMRRVALTNGRLSQSDYASTGGTLPSWTFSTTPFATTEILTGVGTAREGEPSTAVPLFRYYAYDDGELSTTPLPTPLSTVDAARTVRVAVALAVSPGTRTATPDPGAAVSLSDSALLRFSPAEESGAEDSLPCA